MASASSGPVKAGATKVGEMACITSMYTDFPCTDCPFRLFN
jgi:hypothetical protein